MTMKFTGMAAFALFLVTSIITYAAPGDLDVTFGNSGIVDSTIGGFSVGPETLLTQPDGKIVVCGMIYDDGDNYDSSFLARYQTTGEPDASFGKNGKAFPISAGVYTGFDAAVQADGKIVAVGFSFFQGVGFTVYRVNPNGTPDDSFGTQGLVVTHVGTETLNGEFARGVAIQADGKIVVVGNTYIGETSAFGVVRYNTDGSLDTSFNGTGKVITSLGVGGSSAESILIQPDGKLLILGNARDGDKGAFGLARYNVDGTLDPSFGAGGTVIHAVVPTGDSTLRDAALQPDGKIVAAGYTGSLPNAGSAIVRYDPDGSIDASFAQKGIFTTETDFKVGNSVALQSDGKVLAFGYVGFGNGPAVTRLNPNGTVDVRFGVNGRVNTPNFGRIISAGAVQSNGRILTVGGGYATSTIGILRYVGVPPAQFDFDGDLRADLSVFRPSERVWYLDRSTEGFSAIQFGLSTDKISPADYDGDGKADISVYRDGTWYWLESSTNSFKTVRFGQAGDIPVPADYTGDGRDEIAIYRDGFWSALDLSNYQFNTTHFGLSGDKPVPADYDGDGRVDQAVYRNGEWHLNRSTLGYTAVRFGLATDRPVQADYDGDGQTDVAVFRSSDRNWYVRRSSDDAVSAVNWGLVTDIPVPGDYDGDGKTDVAVYRDGIWYILQSSNGGVNAQYFGLGSDVPVAARNIQ